MRNHNILISGGSGALGLTLTRHMVSGSGKINLLVNSERSMDRIRREFSSGEMAQIEMIRTNVLDENQVASAFTRAGNVEVLIHLVGGFAMGDTDSFSLADWDRQIDLNLKSAFLLCKYALKTMRKNGYGRIVTVASRAALQPAAKQAAYSAAKAGLVALTKSIAEETKGTGITANVVAPGTIDTPANREAMGAESAASWVNPLALAEIIAFLASEKAGELRGAVIPVDGNN